MKGIDFNLGSGITFSKHIPEEKDNFDRVFEIFKELITHTSGDIEESFNWSFHACKVLLARNAVSDRPSNWPSTG